MGAETYQRKQCIQLAIKDWWPQSETYKGHDFMVRMRMLQADMIRCHFSDMEGEAKRRAIETLAWLELEQ